VQQIGARSRVLAVTVKYRVQPCFQRLGFGVVEMQWPTGMQKRGRAWQPWSSALTLGGGRHQPEASGCNFHDQATHRVGVVQGGQGHVLGNAMF
jgi:hypothetical protein